MTDQSLRLECLKAANSFALSAFGKAGSGGIDVIKTAERYYEWVTNPPAARSARDAA